MSRTRSEPMSACCQTRSVTAPARSRPGFGVLLAATAVPLWTKNYLLLPPAIAELGLLFSMRRNSGSEIARPIDSGRLGRIHHYGVLGTGIVVPLSLQAIATMRGSHARTLTILSSALTLVGGLLFRNVIVFAGHLSADDPAASFALTRRASHGPLVGQVDLQEDPDHGALSLSAHGGN